MSTVLNNLANQWDVFETLNKNDQKLFIKKHWIHTDGSISPKNRLVRILDNFILFRVLHRLFCGIDIEQTEEKIEKESKSFICSKFPLINSSLENIGNIVLSKLDQIKEFNSQDMQAFLKIMDECRGMISSFTPVLKSEMLVLTFKKHIYAQDVAKIEDEIEEYKKILTFINLLEYSLQTFQAIFQQLSSFTMFNSGYISFVQKSIQQTIP